MICMILFVEDNKNILSLYEECMMTFFPDLEFSLAENGVEALELIEKNNFKAVVTDIDMPVMDGWTLLSKIKDNPMYKVVVTGYSENIKNKDQCDEFKLKPLDLDAFRDLISRLHEK